MDRGQRAWTVAAVAALAAGCASVLGIDKDYVEGPTPSGTDASVDAKDASVADARCRTARAPPW